MIARGQLGRLDGPRGPGIPVVLSIEVADRRLAIRRGPFVLYARLSHQLSQR
jgi:hypothetical protein